MSRWVKILLGAGVLPIAVGVVNVVHMMSLDLNPYTVLIAEKTTELTEGELKIDGDTNPLRWMQRLQRSRKQRRSDLSNKGCRTG